MQKSSIYRQNYRQIPIDPRDVCLVGYSWENHIFLDRTLSMGLRSAAHICQRLTSSIVYMCYIENVYIVNYLDDLAGAEKPEYALRAFQTLGQILTDCGLEESTEKACFPAASMIFIGILFHTLTFTLEIPELKLKETVNLVQTWLNKEKATLTEIQSLLGKLHHVASCVRPGRIFVSRLLYWLRAIISSSDRYFKVPKEIQKDLIWWTKFFPLYNGISMMMVEEWSNPDEIFSTDSCLTGCGGFFQGQFFHAEFPQFVLREYLCINALELLAITVSLKLWGSYFTGKRILVQCDNKTACTVLNTGASKNIFMQSCLREICFYAARFEFDIRATHIESVNNRLADYLSRWHLQPSFGSEFFKLASGFSLLEKGVSSDMFLFTHDW